MTNSAKSEKTPSENRDVLIVDDDEILRDLARRVAEKAGFRVETARGGEEAIELFRKEPDRFDLVLLDLTMPLMSGEEVLVVLREIHPGVQVVLVTGYGEAALTEAERVGSVGLLQKPFTPDALQEVMHRFARSSKDKKSRQ